MKMKKVIKRIADRPLFRYFNFLITGIYGFLKLPYFSYSQHGEDLVLENFFPPGYGKIYRCRSVSSSMDFKYI